jgi:hypothetical protein
MAEATMTTVSRRTTRLLAKDQEGLERVPAPVAHEPRYGGSSDEDKELPVREKTAQNSLELRRAPAVDLGIDLSGVFPTTPEAMGKQGMALCPL